MNNIEWPKYGPLPLEPNDDQWQDLVNQVRSFLDQELQQTLQGPASFDFDYNVVPPGEDLQEWLKALFASGFNTAHPGFLAYIPGGGLVTSALADWLVKTTNRYGTARFASPNLVALEHQVINTFARWVGYDNHFAGVLTTGGSLANFTAVVTARRAKLPENFLDGVLYCSDQTHHSVMKAANLAGFSARNIHVVDSDEHFRLDVTALGAAIQEDLQAGLTPFMVVASAGTTNTGAVDPLPEIYHISQQHQLWFHVDGAYGGAFVITERGRQRLAGIENADSITLDPHKSLFLPYGTGSILVKDRDALVDAHELRGDYMPDLDREQAHLDPFSLSVELTREHRGLKIALPLLLHGEQAFVDALDEKLDITLWLYEQMQQMPQIELLNKPDLTTFAFRINTEVDRDQKTRALMQAINDGKQVFVSGTLLYEEFALRVSILSHRTHQTQLELLIEAIKRGLAEILGE